MNGRHKPYSAGIMVEAGVDQGSRNTGRSRNPTPRAHSTRSAPLGRLFHDARAFSAPLGFHL